MRTAVTRPPDYRCIFCEMDRLREIEIAARMVSSSFTDDDPLRLAVSGGTAEARDRAAS